ncbi:hypothetical protein BDQ17DRAFT_1330300 [Cyathus striatus]|nr:hypothetical protein BDQ17DRAFT_1330300 [Cyathus striatus]
MPKATSSNIGQHHGNTKSKKKIQIGNVWQCQATSILGLAMSILKWQHQAMSKSDFQQFLQLDSNTGPQQATPGNTKIKYATSGNANATPGNVTWATSKYRATSNSVGLSLDPLLQVYSMNTALEVFGIIGLISCITGCFVFIYRMYFHPQNPNLTHGTLCPSLIQSLTSTFMLCFWLLAAVSAAVLYISGHTDLRMHTETKDIVLWYMFDFVLAYHSVFCVALSVAFLIEGVFMGAEVVGRELFIRQQGAPWFGTFKSKSED